MIICGSLNSPYVCHSWLCPILSLDWMLSDFMILLPVATLILKEPKQTYKTSNVHSGFAVARMLPFKFEKKYINKLKTYFLYTGIAIFLISNDFHFSKSIHLCKQYTDWSVLILFQSVK